MFKNETELLKMLQKKILWNTILLLMYCRYHTGVLLLLGHNLYSKYA